MAARGTGASDLALRGGDPRRLKTSPTCRNRGFSDEGDSILAGIPDLDVQETPRGAQRHISATSTARSTEDGLTPTTSGNQDEDAQSSVSGSTAVAAGVRVDPGSRAQARARELEDVTT
ncbi:hypothetical protein MTO96_001833 [Rhipicephalus appendiculatus]